MLEKRSNNLPVSCNYQTILPVDYCFHMEKSLQHLENVLLTCFEQISLTLLSDD